MAKSRKHHVQQELPLDPPTRGGKRKGAGRKPKGPRASERHKARPDLDPGSVLLLTLRTIGGIGNLRRPEGYHAIRQALYAVIEREHFRIVHLSIQSNHVHLIAEANSKDALARGIQAFQISAAKHLNASIVDENGERRRGKVFADRYHERLLGGPRQVRNALAYVLNNWRRHGEDRRQPARKVDPYSSGVVFAGWRELDELRDEGIWYLNKVPRGYIALSVACPQTWLLRIGWTKAKKPISVFDVPGPKRDLFRR